MADEIQVTERLHHHVPLSKMWLGHEPSNPLNLPPALSQFVPASCIYVYMGVYIYIYIYAQIHACMCNKNYL